MKRVDRTNPLTPATDVDTRARSLRNYPKSFLFFPAEPGAHHTTNFVFSSAATGVFLSET
jgi:hypothetical protein